MPGMPGMPGAPAMPGMPPAMPGGAPPPLDPNTMQGAMMEAAASGELAQTTVPAEAAPAVTPPPPVPGMTMASANPIQVETKDDEPSDLDDKDDDYFQEKTEMAVERWAEILSRSIERVIERQQRVVLEKVAGMKARKAMSAGTLDVESVLSVETWDKQMEEDIKPIISAIIRDSHDARKEFGESNGIKVKALPKLDTVKTIDSQVNHLKNINKENLAEINRLYMDCLNLIDGESRTAALKEGIVDMYANFYAKEQAEIAIETARSTWNYAQTV